MKHKNSNLKNSNNADKNPSKKQKPKGEVKFGVGVRRPRLDVEKEDLMRV